MAREKNQFLELAQTVMSLPTAPFCEDLVSGFVKEFAAGLGETASLEEDDFGNLLLTHEGTEAGGHPGPSLIATAHMDHPGLVYEDRLSKREFVFSIKGGIPRQFAKKAVPVAIYNTSGSRSQQPIAGKLQGIVKRADVPAFKLRVSGKSDAAAVGPGSFAMWDLVPFTARKRRIRGRACDDLAGVACGLHYLRRLCLADEPIRAGLLLTRAEEVGFGGMAAVVDGPLLNRSDVYVNIECSNAAVASAEVGGGPVIRVGDRLSIFDPEVTAGMCHLANRLGADFRFQRKLMDGGACEASVMMQAGLRTGAVALPLENYHNNGKKGLRAERIHLDDALNLVKLLAALASSHGGIGELMRATSAHLRSDLNRGQQQHADRLRQTMSAPKLASEETA